VIGDQKSDEISAASSESGISPGAVVEKPAAEPEPQPLCNDATDLSTPKLTAPLYPILFTKVERFNSYGIYLLKYLYFIYSLLYSWLFSQTDSGSQWSVNKLVPISEDTKSLVEPGHERKFRRTFSKPENATPKIGAIRQLAHSLSVEATKKYTATPVNLGKKSTYYLVNQTFYPASSSFCLIEKAGQKTGWCFKLGSSSLKIIASFGIFRRWIAFFCCNPSTYVVQPVFRRSTNHWSSRAHLEKRGFYLSCRSTKSWRESLQSIFEGVVLDVDKLFIYFIPV